MSTTTIPEHSPVAIVDIRQWPPPPALINYAGVGGPIMKSTTDERVLSGRRAVSAAACASTLDDSVHREHVPASFGIGKSRVEQVIHDTAWMS